MSNRLSQLLPAGFTCLFLMLTSGSAFSFTGPYSPFYWTFENDPASTGGTLDVVDGPPVEIFITGGNDSVEGNSDLTIEIPENGTLRFNWGYQSGDAGCWDSGGYVLNGDYEVLACNSDPVDYFSGTATVPVSAGDSFAFRVYTADGLGGAGTLGITGLRFTPSFRAGQNLIGNLHNPGSASTVFGASTTTQYKAFGFDTGPHDGYLDQVELNLDFPESDPGIVVSIWTGDSVPESSVQVLDNPNQLSGSGNFRFRSPSPLFLEPDQRYWVHVRSEPLDGPDFNWNDTGPTVMPTGRAEAFGFVFNDSSSGFFNRLNVVTRPEVLASNFMSQPLPAGGGGTAFGEGSTTQYKAFGFMPPADGASLGPVNLSMNVSDPDAGVVVSLWTGNSVPETELHVLANPGNLNGIGDFTFRPEEEIFLEGGQTYWIHVRSEPLDGLPFSWRTGAPSFDPVGHADAAGFIFNGDASGFLNRIEILDAELFSDRFEVH